VLGRPIAELSAGVAHSGDIHPAGPLVPFQAPRYNGSDSRRAP
jgi:hypothetical protein